MYQNFPQGIATDSSFCNREAERASLKNSIAMHEHIVVVAPRRYGKTSLIMQVLKENAFPSITIDFFFALTQVEVTKMISDGVSKLMNKILPKTTLGRQKLMNSLISLNPKLSFNVLGQKIEMVAKQSSEKSISELLLALDQVAAQSKKNCVIAFDEFQQIGELNESHAVEAAIRHAVERSQYVSYIFCGSKRHLLNEMFTDKSRPLYHLCDLMSIERIETSSYLVFLDKMAKKKWKVTLSKDAAEEILHLTENHPYYVNALCRRLWHNDEIPDISMVRNTWHQYVIQQSAWISNDLTGLTLNRRKVLTALAQQSVIEVQSQAFSTLAGLSPASIKKCVVDLQKLDILTVDKTGYYRLLDPAVAYFIRKNAL